MSRPWEKAQASARAARALLELGDTDNAVDRAYCAMFAAARAALRAIDPELDRAKSHATIISRFGLHLVKTGKLDAELGRMLNETQTLRLTATYEDDSIAGDEALVVIERLEKSMSDMHAYSSRQHP